MASSPALDPDVERVRQLLLQMLQAPREGRVDVLPSSGPYLRAILVSDEFKGEGPASRQNRVWAYLRSSCAEQALLNRLFGVHPYTWDEFREQFQES